MEELDEVTAAVENDIKKEEEEEAELLGLRPVILDIVVSFLDLDQHTHEQAAEKAEISTQLEKIRKNMHAKTKHLQRSRQAVQELRNRPEYLLVCAATQDRAIAEIQRLFEEER